MRFLSAAALCRCFIFLVCCGGIGRPNVNAGDPKPLLRVHAHNDYEHARPLWDALEHGFTSVEADIHLVDGKLLVAHDLSDAKPEKTLQSLYLDPMAKLAREHGGRLYSGWPSVILLVDIKSKAEPTYEVLKPILQAYADVLTRFEHGVIQSNAITIVLSGNRPRASLLAETSRYAAYDGRLEDLGTGASPVFMPLVSDDWSRHFKWRGNGSFPADERAKLKDFVAKARGEKKLLRLWGAPDNEKIWTELNDAGVDLINSDRLATLEKFLRSKQTQ